MKVEDLVRMIRKKRFANLQEEKPLQQEVAELLTSNNVTFEREFRHDAENIFDFLVDGIVIEIKIKGQQKRGIYYQLERYSKLETCHSIILLTNIAMGFPSELNGKPCYIINLGKAWL